MGEDQNAEHEGEGAEAQANPGVRRRARTKIEFPYTDLMRSVEMCRALLEIAGRASVSQTQLAVKLDMSAGGGTFRGRLSAARMFGLIESEGSNVRLSDLGGKVVDAATEQAAMAEAFLNVPLYAAMYERYDGYALPPAAAIERQMQELGVPPKQTERARQAFASSAETAHFIAPNGRFSKPALPAPGGPTPAEDRPPPPGNGSGGGAGGSGGGGGGIKEERPLQYQLIDLLQDAGIGDEERQAVWTLVQFLTRPDKKKATDE